VEIGRVISQQGTSQVNISKSMGEGFGDLLQLLMVLDSDNENRPPEEKTGTPIGKCMLRDAVTQSYLAVYQMVQPPNPYISNDAADKTMQQDILVTVGDNKEENCVMPLPYTEIRVPYGELLSNTVNEQGGELPTTSNNDFVTKASSGIKSNLAAVLEVDPGLTGDKSNITVSIETARQEQASVAKDNLPQTQPIEVARPFNPQISLPMEVNSSNVTYELTVPKNQPVLMQRDYLFPNVKALNDSGQIANAQYQEVHERVNGGSMLVQFTRQDTGQEEVINSEGKETKEIIGNGNNYILLPVEKINSRDKSSMTVNLPDKGPLLTPLTSGEDYLASLESEQNDLIWQSQAKEQQHLLKETKAAFQVTVQPPWTKMSSTMEKQISLESDSRQKEDSIQKITFKQIKELPSSRDPLHHLPTRPAELGQTMLPVREVTMAQLPSRIMEMVRAMVVQQSPGETTFKIKLQPERLGEVTVKLTWSKGELAAQFVTASGLAKEALESSLPQLKEILAQQNIRLSEAAVFMGQQGWQDNQNPFGQTRQGYQTRQTVSAGSYNQFSVTEDNESTDHSLTAHTGLNIIV